MAAVAEPVAPVAPIAHPLQLGQVLYAVHDTSLIFLPPGATQARFQQVSFGGNTEAPKPVIHDAIDVGPLDDIRCARAVTHFASARQEVVILGKSGLSALRQDGESAQWKAVPGQFDDVLRVIGFDPARPESRSLAVLAGIGRQFGTTDSFQKFALMLVEMDTGAAQRFTLPATVKGVAVAAEFVRRGLSAAVVLVTLCDGELQVHTLAWNSLAEQVKDGDVHSLKLGKLADAATAEVSATVTRMQPTSADQQIALAWPDAIGSCQMALIGWIGEGAASVLATAKPDFTFASADRPAYRLASADLLHKGVEQLVLGYPATYGKVGSCVALMLFEQKESPESTATLECLSRYAIANSGNRPFTSYDLHVDAGLFGTCLGVQVIGASATLKQLEEGNAAVSCGFVGVNLDRNGFPPMPDDGDAAHLSVEQGNEGHVLGVMNTEARCLLAFRSDLSGKSILLGPPRFESRSGRSQLLAYIQVPPFDHRTVEARPMLSITTVKGEGDGVSVSDDKSYTLTNDVSFNLGIDSALNLSRSMHDMYGKSFAKMSDVSGSRNVTLHKNFADADHVLIYEVSYNVWIYPVIQPAHSPDGPRPKPAEVIVVIPQDAIRKQNWTPTHELAYRPKAEVGMLLSYVDQDHEGFEAKNQVFMSDDVLTVTTEKDSSSVSFDKQNITSNSEATHFSVMNSISDHLAYTGATELFDVLPVTFGLNVGQSTTDAASRVDTTHLTVHTALTISFNSGSVSDPTYEYTARPVVYRHAKLGCLMLTWDVKTTGLAWKHGSGQNTRLTAPELRLIRPIYKTEDKTLNCFSRSISFVDKKDGTFDVKVEIFNNGTNPALDVSCDFYEGRPMIGEGGLQTPEDKVATVLMDGLLIPMGRRTLKLNMKPTSMPFRVTVQLNRGKSTGPSFIYWGIYPPERYFD